MLRPRIIPCLLLHDGGLVKTVKFGDPKYVGDPLNTVRLFNEKAVDELMVIDIDATVLGNEPDYRMISNLAVECRMPLCYGGGVRTSAQVEKIIALGVEKVALSSAAIEHPEIIAEASQRVGSQSIVVVLDVIKKWRGYEVVIHNGSKRTRKDPIAFAQQAQSLGAGEIVVNAVHRDGTRKGFDTELIKKVHAAVSIPVTALGGAGALSDLSSLVQELGIIGLGAGSLFVFKGKFRAVLIQYPSLEEKESIIDSLQT